MVQLMSADYCLKSALGKLLLKLVAHVRFQVENHCCNLIHRRPIRGYIGADVAGRLKTLVIFAFGDGDSALFRGVGEHGEKLVL